MQQKTISKNLASMPLIGQGTGIGGYRAAKTVYTEIHERALRRGLELGMYFIDTAEIYGHGQAEEMLGRILASAGLRERVLVATKFSPENNSPAKVRQAAEKSLRRLKTDYIDLYQMHWPNPAIPIEETVGAMAHLVEEGKTRAIGLCNCTMRQLIKARQTAGSGDIAAVQMEYNLFDRSIEAQLLPFCEAQGIGVIAYSPLDQGQIVNGADQRACLQSLSDKYDCTPAQLALRWLADHPPVMAIPNASNIAHVEENAAAADIDLTAEDADLIGRVCVTPLQHIDYRKILVAADPKVQTYRTLEEARENRFGQSPSPADIAKDILRENEFKPVRVRHPTLAQAGFEYELIDGRSRFWAWIIAYCGERPIPVYVKGP